MVGNNQNIQSVDNGPCPLCIKRGRPANFGSEPRCAFRAGQFSTDNWACATANILRTFVDEENSAYHWRLRYDDQSYAALFVPAHPQDIDAPEEQRLYGPWRGGGMIAMYWYKNRGQTEGIFRVDPRDGGLFKDASLPLTLVEAEAAIINLTLFSEKLRQKSPTA